MALDNVNLDIHEGEILALVGESGSGKTTLGRILAGLEQATSGKVLFQGEVQPLHYTTNDFRKNAERIQMVFQDPMSSLNPRWTVQETLSEPLLLSPEKPDNTEINRLVKHWLQQVGLTEHHAQRYPFELSGGQRQRVGIARALIREPKLLICDEPISALDVSVQAQIINLLLDIQKKYSLTLLFIAHDLSMVEYVSDRVAVLYHGKIVETGETRRVFDHPWHIYTKSLLHANHSLRKFLE
ncbi:MAG: ABC transporter ATP-binding protein [Pseudomonadales bacterium]|nr:ABC transporter ATP-binding protein [Pseudomonadales bacterium]